MTRHASLLAMLVLSLAVGCASFTGNESAQLTQQDEPEALRIKAALLDEPDLPGAAIDVRYDQGRVTLTGFVETREQKQLAERVARRQQGVTDVENDIEVK